MNQPTPAKVLEQEQQLIRNLAKLSEADTITFNDLGWDSRVYLVNGGQYVFKFPRREQTKQQYESEIPAFRLMAQITADVSVPVVTWEHPDNEYLGYKGVPGVSLDTVVAALSTEQKHAIGKKVGGFLAQLHRLELSDTRVVSIVDEIKQFQDNYTARSEEIHKAFTADEQKKLHRFMFDTMPPIIASLGGSTVLCHADLGYWNIVYGPEGQVGIIDFGDIAYYDPSKDFMGLEDPEVLDAALAVYGDDPVLRQKIAIRQTALRIVDVPYYNEQALPKVLASIRAATA